jgi:hypothetical protein
MLSGPKISSFVLIAVFLVSCKPGGPGSSLKAKASANSLKTGMFMPIVDTESLAKAASSRIKSPEELASKLRVTLNSADTYRVSTAADGENILLVERKGMMPIPVFSLGSDGARYQWSFLAYKGNNGEVVNGHVYIRHELFGLPTPFVSADGRKSNIYVMRTIYGRDGTLEPLLVSWLNHIAVSPGDALYRVGNVIYAARTDTPIVGFNSIGNQVWEMTGLFENEEINPGTIFWSRDLTEFYSLSPKIRKIVKWKKQDDDSMDRLGVVAKGSVNVPSMVEEAVVYREKIGLGAKGKMIPLSGTATTALGSGIIPLYPTDDMYLALNRAPAAANAASNGFSLSADSDDDFFVDQDIMDLKRVGAVTPATDDHALALTDQFADAVYSGNGPRAGSLVSIKNNNNGTSFPSVRIISNEPHLVARNGWSRWWTGSSDHQGYRMTGEILDSRGNGTGRFLEQIVNKSAGVYDQKITSMDQTIRDAQRVQATQQDTMRSLNTKIFETSAVARDQGAMADRLEQSYYKGMRELPGRAISSAVTAGVTEKYKIGQGATATVPVWFATGAAKELGGQTINRGIGVATSDWGNWRGGIQSYDPASVGWAGFGGALGKGATDGWSTTGNPSGAVAKKFVEDLVTKPITVPGTQGYTPMIQGKPVTAGRETIPLAVADTATDAIFAGLGTAVGGPAGKAAGAAGAEVAKVATRGVGSLIVTDQQMRTLNTVNGYQTSAINSLSNARSSNAVSQYIQNSGRSSTGSSSLITNSSLPSTFSTNTSNSRPYSSPTMSAPSGFSSGSSWGGSSSGSNSFGGSSSGSTFSSPSRPASSTPVIKSPVIPGT